jgi:rod shape-determining protein MreC
MLLQKNRVIRRRAVVGLLVAASLTLLTMSYREGSTGVVGSVQDGVVELTAPFASVAHRVTSPFVDGWHWTTGLIHARNQTAELHRLQNRVGRDESMIKELRQELRTAQQNAHWVQENAHFKTVSGSVIATSPDTDTPSVLLGIGGDDGVELNDPVVAPVSDGGALVGRVKAVTGSTATVQVLLDPAIGVTATVQGEQGANGTIVPSTGTPGELTMAEVPQSVLVKNGDTVVTSGYTGKLGSLYPDGIPIGRVTYVQNNDLGQQSKQIQVTPFVNFNNLGGVVVLEMSHGQGG